MEGEEGRGHSRILSDRCGKEGSYAARDRKAGSIKRGEIHSPFMDLKRKAGSVERRGIHSPF
jgi:hypothetical protein